MKVSVTRTGGFAGLSRTWVVLVEEQPDADEWMSLLEQLPWNNRPHLAPAPDRFVYVIRASRRRITLPEQAVEGPWRDLVEKVRDRAI